MTTEHNRRSSDLQAMEITQLKFEVERLNKDLNSINEVVSAHNQYCIDMCKNGGYCGFKGRNRNCSSCFKDNMIELPPTTPQER